MRFITLTGQFIGAPQHDRRDNPVDPEACQLEDHREQQAVGVRTSAHEVARGEHARLFAVSREAILRHLQFHRGQFEESNGRLHVRVRCAGHGQDAHGASDRVVSQRVGARRSRAALQVHRGERVPGHRTPSNLQAHLQGKPK